MATTRRNTSKGLNPWVVLVVASRIGGIAFIPVNPALGMGISFVMDYLDAVILVQKARYSHEQYHVLDKVIDLVWSLVMLGVGFGTPYFFVLSVLFVFRMIGFLLHMITRQPIVYVLFPNVFEFVFVWYAVIAPFLGGPRVERVATWQVVLTCLVFKEAQEYLLHVWWPKKLAVYRKTGWPPLQRALGWKHVD